MARTVVGRLSVHPRGFGFLEIEGGGPPPSAFVAPPELGAFLAGDRVRATLRRDDDGRSSASQLELVERARDRLFGVVVGRRGSWFLRPDREVGSSDWPLVFEPGGVAPVAGRSALARIERDARRVRLEQLFAAEADLSLEQVIARYGLASEFGDAELAEARAARSRPHALAGGRRDLRAVPTVTVDAPSTRDIDDAIAVLPADGDGAMRLLVSIADVAEHVAPASALDRAARARATSVYLAGRVLPMLPEELSADWLSLLPGHDRGCLTVELRLDPEGRITAVDLYESLIRSQARVSYAELAQYLDRGVCPPPLAGDPAAAGWLPWLRTAAARLELLRSRRGGVRHAQDDTHILFDDASGEPTRVEPVRLTSAHALVERFMVAANEAVALWLRDRGVPALYRVHAEPPPESAAELAAAARHFGFEAGFGERLTPLSLAAFDRQISGTPCEPALRSVLLRSLGAARYSTDAEPHFGLAAPLYLHFTSPIRRYADLGVHRLIKAYLRGERAFARDRPELERLAEHINARARGAARAERDRSRILIARLMAEHIGEVCAAHITRVRAFGLTAQLDESFVEGTLLAESLPDGPYRPDERETALVGPRRSFAIGMPLAVRVVACDVQLGRVELALVEREGG
jgi:ribonuclease R